jgi:hypothetical protein
MFGRYRIYLAGLTFGACLAALGAHDGKEAFALALLTAVFAIGGE